MGYQMTSEDAERSRLMGEDAAAYFAAARKVLAGESAPSIFMVYRMPANFLLAQCCELALKSMLSQVGWDEKRWMVARIGHDLAGLVEAVLGEGLALDPEFVSYCELMGDAHREHHFRYPGRASPGFGDPFKALEMIEPQVRVVAPHAMW